MNAKTATTAEPVNPLIAERWSPRAFDAGRAIGAADITRLFEAARWAPSCYNEQPWRFVVCDRFEDEAAWQAALDCLAPKNRLWAQNAPLLALVAAKTDFTHNGKPNRWAEYDAGLATAGLTLQATGLGIHIHQMGGFDSELACANLGVPAGMSPIAMLAIGYQGDIAALHEDFVGGESAKRERKPLDEIVFTGKWA